MIETLRKIFALLAIGGQKKLCWLIAAIILLSLLDMVGIASIFPFLNVISNPEIVQTNAKLKWVYERLGFTSKDNFLIALGAASLIILVVGNIFRALITMVIIRFSWFKHYAIAKQLLIQYLYEPYSFFLNRNSSELIVYLQTQVARVVSDVLLPCMQLFTRSLLTLLIVVLLFVINPLIALVVLVIIGGGYGIIYAFFRKKLSRSGKELLMHNKKMHKVLNEAFGGIKDIKLIGKEHVFIEQYADPAKKIINCYCSQFLIAQFPRYAFEVLAFGGILFMAIYIAVIQKSYGQVIPLVGLYAFAAYRLMPTLQMIFQDLTSIRFGLASLETIYQDYASCSHKKYNEQIEPAPILPFLRNVEFCHITFQYPKAQKSVIEDLNLNIKANTTIGFVGSTGAGKTTVIDILLGLLWPNRGEIIVDGTKLSADNLRMWQKNIGYVPQHVYLSDDTITRNIAFGVPDHEIDRQAVQHAAQLANIHDFITDVLPNKYETVVGERGIRLSGGQRQRIGIARALYYNPSLLVFDEATSALDGITENTILEAIYNLTHKKTMIIIAHRLSTVKECDIIYLLEHGRIVSQGTYQGLLATNRQFRMMAHEDEKSLDLSQLLADTPKVRQP